MTTDQMLERLDTAQRAMSYAIDEPELATTHMGQAIECILDVVMQMVTERSDGRLDFCTCTDCGDVLAAAAYQQHMAEMHGVMHAPYEKGPAYCPKCGEAPCCKMVEAKA